MVHTDRTSPQANDPIGESNYKIRVMETGVYTRHVCVCICTCVCTQMHEYMHTHVCARTQVTGGALSPGRTCLCFHRNKLQSQTCFPALAVPTWSFRECNTGSQPDPGIRSSMWGSDISRFKAPLGEEVLLIAASQHKGCKRKNNMSFLDFNRCHDTKWEKGKKVCE